jgi:glycine/serine hydroxymethyltransferase
MREDAIRQVGRWIVSILDDPENLALGANVREDVRSFVQDYPVPADAAKVAGA